MIRIVWIVLALLLGNSSVGWTQHRSVRDVPKGDVTGLEMAVDGSKSAIPGSTLRWFVTVFEIVKGRRIRPAPGTKLDVLVSYQPNKVATSSVTDSFGRASLAFDLPDTLEDSFTMIVEARSTKGLRRRFDVLVQLNRRRKIEFFVEKERVPAGAGFRVWGRVLDNINGSPVVNTSVGINLQQQGRSPSQLPKLRTDANGVFHTLLRAPDKGRSFSVSASAKYTKTARHSLSLVKATHSALFVYARPEKPVVSDGETVLVDVVVRLANGKPVSGATLKGLSIPKATTAREEKAGKKKVKPVVTDALGRAKVPWKPRSNTALTEKSESIHALREGIGIGQGVAEIRVVRVPVLFSWAVEGGTMTPGLPARMFFRAFHPDGSPWSGLPISVAGANVVDATSRTNQEGVAMLETGMGKTLAASSSGCGGATVVALRVKLGNYEKDICAPVDRDATLRIRSSAMAREGIVNVEIDRLASVSKVPIALTMLNRQGGGPWLPVSQVVVKSKTKSVKLSIPVGLRGTLWLRARPLMGAERRPVRGGSTLVWSRSSGEAKLDLRANASGGIKLTSSPGVATGFAIAVSPKRGQKLLRELQAGQEPLPAGSSDMHWLGYLASQTPLDRSVPALLREGRLVIVAMPSDAVSLGLLRDPWRSQSRFVRGRLGRIFLDLESRLRDTDPEDLSGIGIRNSRGWRFNSEILTGVAGEIGIEAIAGLDGSPLNVADLKTLAPYFTYDNVARRVTRERLLKVLVALRQFVKSNHLDFAWASRGDPRRWLKALIDWEDDEGEIRIALEDLYDAWGHPMAIRKAKGGRARFRFLEPVLGFELVSAGPDGEFGNRDDLFDPFARVLPQGSVYGDAVGEEALLARLHGVELGRATIEALSEIFSVGYTSRSSESTTGNTMWTTPNIVSRNDDILLPQRVEKVVNSFSTFVSLAPGGGPVDVELSLPTSPRNYVVVGGRYGTRGSTNYDSGSLHAGIPLALELKLPPRLRPKEPLIVPITLIGLGKSSEVSVTVRGTGVVVAQLMGPSKIVMPAGKSVRAELRIRALRAGKGSVKVALSSGGRTIQEFSQALVVSHPGNLLAQHDGALIVGKRALEVRTPSEAKAIRSFLVLSGPQDILKDPGMERIREKHPELLAWAHSQRGDPMSPSLHRRLVTHSAPSGAMSALRRACLAVGWSGVPETPENRADRQSALLGLEMVATDMPESARQRSALLVALASSSGGQFTGTTSPLLDMVEKLRAEGWVAGRTEKSRPTVMARLAAGLLLADARDMPGRGLFELARRALVKGERGGRHLLGENGQDVDGWIGTLALAIAARQLGEDQLAEELAVAIGARLYVGMQGRAEPAFWLLAASVYGVFGATVPDAVSLEIDGSMRSVRLQGGIAVIPLPAKGAKVLIESQSLIARVESRYLRAAKARNDSSLRTKITGDVGATLRVAPLLLSVENHSDGIVVRPVVEVLLPSAGTLSQTARKSMNSTEGVSRVSDPDAMGIIRVYLDALAPKQTLRIPFPIEWVGKGRVSGLSTQSYSADSPWKRSTTLSRSFVLNPAKEETWK